jgi:ribosome-associated protein
MKPIHIPFSELSFSFARSSGAGGQNVNKVNSKVTMTWNAAQSPSCPPQVLERFIKLFPQYVLSDGSIQITEQSHRSQKANIDECIERLHRMLKQAAIPPKTRKPTKPKRSAVLKRLETKKKDSQKKRLRKNWD